jgi:bifunctional UDP-N-acetylglucosamine pyrophosphorylase/glucosamine-1-phosphate N-acetyltransferase
LKPGCYIEDSVIGEQCVLGPYAHLRPGTVLKKKVKIGNFVELKKATMDDGSKASHLSYIGDAEVGKEVNIGCGFITCNYNGITKEKTIIEDNVFVGSDSQTVAPVTIGKGSYVASGTTVTKNVPPDSLVISRGRQTVRPGYAKRFQKK